MIRKLNEKMSRSQLIDAIDNVYSYDDAKVDAAICDVLNINASELDTLDDSNEYEGFYYNFTTQQLQQIYNIVTNQNSNKYLLKLNSKEVYLLIDAMNNYSDPTFTKDREMSTTAAAILTKLREL